MSESFEERVRGLMSPIRSRWLKMPSERNRHRMRKHSEKALYHIEVYRQRLLDGHRHRAIKHLRVAIGHLSRGLDRASGEYHKRDQYGE